MKVWLLFESRDPYRKEKLHGVFSTEWKAKEKRWELATAISLEEFPNFEPLHFKEWFSIIEEEVK